MKSHEFSKKWYIRRRRKSCHEKTKLKQICFKKCEESSKSSFKQSNHHVMLQYSSEIVGYLNCHPRKKKRQDKDTQMVLVNTDKSVH